MYLDYKTDVVSPKDLVDRLLLLTAVALKAALLLSGNQSQTSLRIYTPRSTLQAESSALAKSPGDYSVGELAQAIREQAELQSTESTFQLTENNEQRQTLENSPPEILIWAKGLSAPMPAAQPGRALIVVSKKPNGLRLEFACCDEPTFGANIGNFADAFKKTLEGTVCPGTPDTKVLPGRVPNTESNAGSTASTQSPTSRPLPSQVNGNRITITEPNSGARLNNLDQLFGSRPDVTALLTESEPLSYSELNERSNALAAKLITISGQSPACAVYAPVGQSLVVAMIAIFKAGGTYIPLDIEAPMDTNVDILNQLSSPLILHSGNHRIETTSLKDASTLNLDTFNDRLTAYETPGHTSEDIAYIFFTSGSTGRPKGVLGTYANLAFYVDAIIDRYGFDEHTCVPTLAKPTFSISLFELLAPLVAGGKVYPRTRPQVLDIKQLISCLDHVTTVHMGPTLCKAILKASRCENSIRTFKQITHASLGGDTISPDILLLISEVFPEAEIYTVYGCSEIACMGTTYRYWPLEAAERPLVGSPFHDTSLVIADESGSAVPIGSKGEVYFSGPGVTKGYLNQDKLTAEKYRLIDGKRYFKTGDIGRLNDNLQLELLGRSDFQVKISGVRIELASIDYHLRQLHGVVDAVAGAKVLPGHSSPSIIAFIIAAPDVKLQANELFRALRKKLPKESTPAGFVLLDEIPVNKNLKVDRKALPEVSTEDFLPLVSDPGQSTSSELLPTLELIKAATGRNLTEEEARLSFLALGFNSLDQIAIRSATERKYGIKLEIEQFLSDITSPEQLASTVVNAAAKSSTEKDGLTAGVPDGFFIKENRPDDSCIALDQTGKPTWKPLNKDSDTEELKTGTQRIDAVVPLTPAQLEIFLACNQSTSANQAFNLPFKIVFNQQYDNQTIIESMSALISRHELLRAYVNADGNTWVISHSTERLNIEDLSESANRENFYNQAFDLGRGPLWRLGAMTSAEQTELVIVLHHIIADGWSVDLLIEELCEQIASPPSSYNSSSTSYTSTLASTWHLRQARRKKHLAYWSEKLSSTPPPLALPEEYTRPNHRCFDARGTRRRLNQNQTRDLKRLAQELDVSLYTLMHTLTALVLERITLSQDFILGMPFAGQLEFAELSTFGHDVRVLPIRHTLTAQVSLRELVYNTQKSINEALSNSEVSLLDLLEVAGVERTQNRPPLISVVLSQDPVRRRRPNDANVLEITPLSRRYENYELMINLVDLGNALELEAHYSKTLFSGALIERWLDFLSNIASQCCQNPEASLDDISSCSEADRRLLASWNKTEYEFAEPQHLAEIYTRQVTRSPNAIALIDGETQLTYSEFDLRVQKLAGILTARLEGSAQGAVIAVLLDRSVEMLVALHAIIVAGGCYTPIGTDQPKNRIIYQLKDSSAVILIKRGQLDYDLSEAKGLCVVDLDQQDDSQQATLEDRNYLPTDPAYIIYTSGSTGNPKGVRVAHRAICNRLAWAQKTFAVKPGERLLQKTPYTFDVSVWELFWPLQVGATLVIAPPDSHKDPEQIARILKEQMISIVHFVPTVLEEFLRCSTTLEIATRAFLCSGEALSVETQREFNSRYPGIALHNLYGPTEAAVDVSHWQCDPDTNDSSVPIGRPISNVKLHVVNNGRLAPVGTPGELIIEGIQVADGYVNRPELTAKVFSGVETTENVEQRLYHTGDLAKWTTAGVIKYLGRIDNQVKLRGVRIELGEIESYLNKIPTIAKSVVTIRNSGSNTQLIAFYIADNEMDSTALRRMLATDLAPHLLPHIFKRIDQIPTTSSGKTDTKRLLTILDSESVDQAGDTEKIDGVNTDTELIVKSIWEQELQVENLNRNDDFFSVGGNSLSAVRVTQQLRQQLDIELDLTVFIQYPVLSDFADHIWHKSRDSGLSDFYRLKGGQGKKLFCLHGVLLYKYLADHLPEDYSVYGMYLSDEVAITEQADLPSSRAKLGSVASIAQAYKHKIEKIQPIGPYHLLGESFGGILALEVGRLFLSEGQTVNYIGMLDTSCPDPLTAFSFFRKIRNRLMVACRYLSRLLSNSGSTEKISIIDIISPMKQLDNSKLAIIRRHAVRGYKPQPIDSLVNLYRATDRVALEAARKDLGWGRHLDKLQVTDIKGSHIGILKPPYVERLANEISQALGNSTSAKQRQNSTTQGT